jgi:hypothetical protein
MELPIIVDHDNFWNFWSWPFMFDEHFCMKSNSILASIQFGHKWHVDHLLKIWCLMTSCLVFADQGPMCLFWTFSSFYSITFDVI